MAAISKPRSAEPTSTASAGSPDEPRSTAAPAQDQSHGQSKSQGKNKQQSKARRQPASQSGPKRQSKAGKPATAANKTRSPTSTARRKTATAQPLSARCLAVLVLQDVLRHDLTLDHAIDKHLASLPARDRAFAQHLCYATLRQLNALQALATLLLDKPLPRKYFDIELLLLLGLLQLWDSHVAEHAAVSATVNVCNELGKNWARRLINAGLRRFQRERDGLLQQVLAHDANRYATPAWLLQQLQQDWPQRWRSLLQQAQRPAPMWLRVNLARNSREDYLRLLAAQHIAAAAGNSSADVLLRDAVAVEQLPGFAEGLVSVQDSSAQFAATLLHPEPGQRVLDLCAAPGGKSCQLLEQFAPITLLSVDLQPQRLQRLRDNYQRLGLSGQIVCGDARHITADADGWWDGEPFDRILLDAPCSASGVIRRHPDIKWRLQPDKLNNIITLQQQLLQQAWQLLQPGGQLLYSTCSVLQAENDTRIAAFLAAHADASSHSITLSVGQPTAHGWQCLTGDGGGDGMYFALLRKAAC